MKILTFILLIVLGITLVRKPELLWKFECKVGWKYGEATKAYLFFTKFCGVFCIVAAFYGMFFK